MREKFNAILELDSKIKVCNLRTNPCTSAQLVHLLLSAAMAHTFVLGEHIESHYPTDTISYTP